MVAGASIRHHKRFASTKHLFQFMMWSFKHNIAWGASIAIHIVAAWWPAALHIDILSHTCWVPLTHSHQNGRHESVQKCYARCAVMYFTFAFAFNILPSNCNSCAEQCILHPLACRFHSACTIAHVLEPAFALGQLHIVISRILLLLLLKHAWSGAFPKRMPCLAIAIALFNIYFRHVSAYSKLECSTESDGDEDRGNTTLSD